MQASGRIIGRGHRVGPMGLVVLLLLLCQANRPARAGYCAGNKQRVLKTIERLRFGAEELAGAFVLRFVQPVRIEAPAVLGRLALWSLYLQARQLILDRMLARELDREHLEALRRVWRQASEVLRSKALGAVGGAPSQVGVEWMVGSVIGGWAVCQEMRDPQSQACQVLVGSFPDLAESCRAPSANVVRFVQGCRSLGSEALGASFDAYATSCKASGPETAGVCRAVLAGLGSELAACRAVASDDPSACTVRGLTPRRRIECESVLAAHRYLSGRIDEQAFLAAYRGGHRGAIAAVGPTGRDCILVGLERFDRFAIPFFQLAPAPLGALPDL